ncbi:hypothetical protein I6E29_00735 [Arcanobacterium haemolyticum]|nr:hypothetical protein [Arcanobacterium haemolyticum]
MYEVFLSRSDIAIMYGVDPSQVSRWMRGTPLEPDVVIGVNSRSVEGYRRARVEAWRASLPKPGERTDLKK